jgi:Raf kinase inhibitor-like YbhB/YbcL family protein
MKLSSAAFDNNEMIPLEYSCDGENINPPLSIADVPEGAVSLALIVEDPDAPGEVFTHWVVFNIDPDVEDLDEDDVPDNTRQGLNSNGQMGYAGPCPPSGTHHYVFHLYALDDILDLPPAPPTREEVEESMEDHIISQTELVGLYQR